jgi:hypothetical protein
MLWREAIHWPTATWDSWLDAGTESEGKMWGISLNRESTPVLLSY